MKTKGNNSPKLDRNTVIVELGESGTQLSFRMLGDGRGQHPKNKGLIFNPGYFGVA